MPIGDRKPPSFRAFYNILSTKAKPNAGLLARLRELADYGFFDGEGETKPVGLRVADHHSRAWHDERNVTECLLVVRSIQPLQRHVPAWCTSPPQPTRSSSMKRIARRVLKLIPQFAKECRKFGLSLILASQEAKDFNASLFLWEVTSFFLQTRLTLERSPDDRRVG